MQSRWLKGATVFESALAKDLRFDVNARFGRARAGSIKYLVYEQSFWILPTLF